MPGTPGGAFSLLRPGGESESVTDTDNKNSADQDTLERLSRYLPFASLYAIAAGTLFLWGFWSTFDINILQYIGLVELAKSAAFPLLSAVASVAIGALVSRLTMTHSFPYGGGADTPVGRFLNKHVKWLIGGFLAFLLAIALLGNEERKWFGVGMLASVAFSLALARRDAFSGVIADPTLRGSIIWLVSLIICAAFGYGRNKAYDIITGHEYFVVDQASIQHVTGVRISRAGELKYLGQITCRRSSSSG